jgi:hypothetical protein
MKILLNDKELAYFINSLYNHWSESIKENVYTHDKTFECLKEWKLDINAYKKYFKCIHKNMDHFINKFGKENIFKLYKKSKFQNFVKSTGITINPSCLEWCSCDHIGSSHHHPSIEKQIV